MTCMDKILHDMYGQNRIYQQIVFRKVII